MLSCTAVKMLVYMHTRSLRMQSSKWSSKCRQIGAKTKHSLMLGKVVRPGVGTDPREDRYFSIPKKAQSYDPDGDFVAYWLPQLKPLPKEKRHYPGMLYIKLIVPLKFGNRPTTATGARRGDREDKEWKSRKGNQMQ